MKVYDAQVKFTLVREDLEPPALFEPESVVAYLADAFAEFPDQEQIFVIMLNGKNRPKGRIRVSLGTVGYTACDPTMVFRPALLAAASGVIIAHNHPSGDPAPSSADLNFTRKIREAGAVLGIPLLDHVIAGTPQADPTGRGFYSFRLAGLV